MIPHEYVQEVVRRNDIADVVGQYVQLRAAGGAPARGCAPSTTKRRPPLWFTPETQSFYCFGCGAGGDVITFVRKISNLGYVEAVKQLASRAGMPLPEEEDQESRRRSRLLEINRCAARYFFEQLNAPTPEAGAARGYWRRSAAWSDAAIRRFGLGYAPDSFYRASALPQAPRIFRAGAGGVRPGQAQRQGQPVRYLPPPGHGAHHRRAGQHHRFWRPRAGRLQAQVHQQPRNDGLQKVPHAVRPQRGQKVPLQAVYPVRGLHGRYQHARGRL